MKRYTTYYLSLFILLILFACKSDKIERLDQEELITKKYDHLINERISECKNKAELEAENKVDSLIDKLLKKDLIDSIRFPDKPVRPDRPETIIE